MVTIPDQVGATKRRSVDLFEDCYVVTNFGIYLVRLSRDPVTAFLESATQGDVKSAERVAVTFGLDTKAGLTQIYFQGEEGCLAVERSQTTVHITGAKFNH